MIMFVVSIYALVDSGRIQSSEIVDFANALKSNPLKFPVFVAFSMLICFINLPLGVITKVLSGWLFGFTGALLISHTSILLGSWLAFRLARFLGREFVEKWFSQYIHKLDLRLAENELMNLVRIRIFPFIPLPVANFCLGITNVSDRNFILSGMIGMLPATTFYSFIGSQMGQLSNETISFKGFIPY